ncbi:hypothetical protein FQN57_005597 [Myotisia sp. PD_48]|nr:hypothetical protein FQN57_005597 [Myotisia sp. PD_48]
MYVTLYILLPHAKPDHFYGARPEQLDRQIRDKLEEYIIPSTQHDLPILPNFFLEAKGPDGTITVLMRQACYEGALAARGYAVSGTYDQFILGVSAYRNARDWAKEKRDAIIEEANRRHRALQDEIQSVTEGDTINLGRK